MGDVVNLNKFRKRKVKAEREKRAETNRRLHGRTKSERARELKQQQLLDNKLDGARLTKTEPELTKGEKKEDPEHEHEHDETES